MIFMALISCGVFGYTINSIGILMISRKINKNLWFKTGNILSDFKKKSDKYLTELAKMNSYFK